MKFIHRLVYQNLHTTIGEVGSPATTVLWTASHHWVTCKLNNAYFLPLYNEVLTFYSSVQSLSADWFGSGSCFFCEFWESKRDRKYSSQSFRMANEIYNESISHKLNYLNPFQAIYDTCWNFSIEHFPFHSIVNTLTLLYQISISPILWS